VVRKRGGERKNRKKEEETRIEAERA